MPPFEPDQPDLSPFRGLWVALVRGQVAGHGRSEAEARLSAQLARPKEVPRVIRVSSRPELRFPRLFDRVRDVVADRARVWLVGGSVRDALLGREIHDLDFAVDGDALALARRVANALHAAFYILDDERDNGRVIVERGDGLRDVVDFARLRAPDILSDLRARDFTLNAIAVALDAPDELIDPLHGEADLRDKVLRACSPTAIHDDPVRALRAVRLAAQFDLRMDRPTREWIRDGGAGLSRVSAERTRDEFVRALGGRRPAAAVRALDALGLLESLLPEVRAMKGCAQPPPHVADVWRHSVDAVDRMDSLLAALGPNYDPESAADLTLGYASVKLGRFRSALHAHVSRHVSGERPARWLLMLSTLLHDVGKPATRSMEADGRIRFFEHEAVGATTIARRASALRFSNLEVDRLAATVREHMRPLSLAHAPEISRRAVYRYFRDAGPAGVEVALLSLADTLATYQHTLAQPVWHRHVEVARTLLEAYFESGDQRVSPTPLLTGTDLLTEFGLAPGPRIGQLLEEIREAQAAGEVHDRQAAIAFARRRLGR